MGRLLLADGVIDLDRAEVVRGPITHHLTGVERELLVYLAERTGRDIGRDELHARVWGHAPHVVSRAADFTVHRLRRKLEQAPDQPVHLVTATGGYRWVPAVQAAAAPPIGTVVIGVVEPVEPGDARWLEACARVTRAAGVYLAELAPDRVVLAAPDDGTALAAAAGLVAIAPARIGLARGPAGCLVDPLSGRTLYGGPTLARAGRLA
ncbi:MAG: winged helix-turn-helix domain-containing protein, partial [Myxococcota bacterium]